jgi:hypothetical protein
MKRTRLTWSLSFGLLLGCGTSSEPGVEVRFVSLPVGSNPGVALPNVSGHEVLLDELAWTTSELELLPCRSALQRAADWLVPSAMAHGVSTPTRLSSPAVERATAAEELVLGSLEPPAGRYCGLRYSLGAADPDAAGLTAAPHMQGRSVAARGRVTPPSGTASDFSIESARGISAEYPLDFELSESRRHVTVTLDHASERWFTALDLSATAAEREARLLDNLLESLEVRSE